MSIAWSPQQERARTAVSDWLRNPSDKPVFRLQGYAGTGKTTLAKTLAQDVNGSVHFAAFTGKAAHVLVPEVPDWVWFQGEGDIAWVERGQRLEVWNASTGLLRFSRPTR